MTHVLRIAATALLAALLALPLIAPPPAPAAPPEPGASLRAALQRDLAMSWEDYLEAGRLAEQAADLDRRLTDDPGYRGISVIGAEVVITGTGNRVDLAAQLPGVRVRVPAGLLGHSELRERYRAEVDAGGAGLFGVGWSGDGWLLTVADPDSGGVLADGRAGISPQQFAARHPEVTVRAGALATARADILGGQGWGSENLMPRCSIGFAAFAPNGEQAMLTAGHCSNDGALTDARWESDRSVSLGRLTYSQFGGPGNATNTTGTAGADLSVYAGSAPDLRSAIDSYSGAVRVTGVSSPVTGAPVCTSGRSTRSWQCSTIESVGPYAVHGPRGGDDVRWIDGFTTRMTSLSGDSGAGMVTGLQAVGILSAGGNYSGVEYSFGAALSPVLDAGHTLEVWLNEPRAAAAAAGQVRGSVPVDDRIPANTTVRFEGATTSSAPVAPDGSFSLPAPAERGRLVTANGFSRSEVVDFDPRFGAATGPYACGLRAGGCFQGFPEGLVYTSTAGTHQVKGAIYEQWAAMGWETGWVGYPTSPEMCGLAGGGCWQTFEGGRMYWSADTGANPVRGALGAAWNRTGYEQGFLGYPTSLEFCGLADDGCFQRYQGGSFYWSPGTGAQWTRGAIRGEWSRLGWERGQLGYPVSEEFCDLRDGGCLQRFERGTMYWSASAGTHPVQGAIFAYWAENQWEAGRFGYPVSAEECGTIEGEWTCTQRFEGGTITWTAARGAQG